MKSLLFKGVAAAVLVAAVAVPAASAKSTVVKLSVLPLPKSALGASAKSLALAHDSGAVSNGKAEGLANVTPNPGTFKKLGRVTGYTLDYGAVFAGSAGVSDVQTAVDHYKTSADAKKGLAFWKKDDPKIKIVGGFGIQVSDKAFSAPALGSARFGNVWTMTLTGVQPVSLADVQIADGPYVLSVKVAGGSASAAKALSAKLAKKLDQRLRLALAGRLHAATVKLPAKLKAGAPSGGPDLSTLALQASDLTGSATIVDQAYHVDPLALSDYALDFQPAGQFDDLSQEIEWYGSANEATFLASFQQAFFSAFVTAVGGQVTPVDLSSVGDNASGSIMDVTIAGQTTYLAVVALSRGQASDLVIAGGSSQPQASDVQSLAQAMANRLDAGVSG